jgi:transposase-like protein
LALVQTRQDAMLTEESYFAAFADRAFHNAMSLSLQLIEQDHRGVKLRISPMLGLKRFGTAAATIAGIELHRRIYKGRFNLGGLHLKDRCTPAVWKAVLAVR